MELPILQEVVIILGLSVLIILAFQRLKMPSILGFLITGIVAGPNALKLVSASHEVEMLSEIGIIFLLFIIGIEFSIKGLAKVKKTVLLGGFMQVGGTIILTIISTFFLGLTIEQSVFMGFLISLSSTAIVLKMLSEKGQMTSPHGRIALAILIFQDFIVVPMILVTPMLAGNGGNIWLSILGLFTKFALVVVILIVLARYGVPILLQKVVKTRSRELFILTIVVLCFATAWLTSSVGLSLALGAFFAGLIISESDYSHQATASILPFREIFISFFFVSVGMLLDISYFFQHFFILLLITVGVILLKVFVVAITVLLLRFPLRTALISALTIFQVGEFSFLLSTIGMRHALLSQEVYQSFLVISILTMGLTPFISGYSDKISDWFIKVGLNRKVRKRFINYQNRRKQSDEDSSSHLHDHLIIVGLGINGHNIARTASKAKIPFVIIEIDPDIFRKSKENGLPVVFGDASDELILNHVHASEARVVVIAISDPEATKQIISVLRQITETAHVIVRTRNVEEMDAILKLGADEVIPEEFETSIQIFTRVLSRYLIPFDKVQSLISQLRAHNYEVLSQAGNDDQFPAHLQLHIPDMVIATLPVQRGNNKIVGKTIGESGLRNRFGVNVLAIRRNNRYFTEIKPEMTIETDDMLYLFGNPEKVAELNKYFLSDVSL
ncbi:MAG: potassium transporter KefB [Bacteroidetes bacterium HGW-Bacteroidetes-1]|jgi:CPA2 family monovalent cation:H+ antiporter-2|nr:MAG: potassium transporter KefB [Bacteroidetes bacterium HGW-Bacteroidetes-1]